MKKLALGISLFLLLSAGVSEGYLTYPFKWPPSSVAYDQHSLSTAWKSAAYSGAFQWNNVSGSGFSWGATDYEGNDNDVYLGSIDGAYGTLGVTTTTYSGSSIIRTNIRFDNSENWYTGSSAPLSTQLDAISVAAHEFGHGLGLDHTQSYNCSGSENTRPTMCAYYSHGKTWGRSLEQDDRSGVVAVYPIGGMAAKAPSGKDASIHTHFLYESAPIPKKIKRSGFIVSGFISFISDTSWNQDTGEYWEDTSADGGTIIPALPYFTVDIVTDVILLGPVDLPRKITLTILGESPHSANKDADLQWREGDEVVIFGRKTQLAWREGSKDILQPVGSIEESMAIRGENDLFYIHSQGKKEGYSVGDLEKLVKTFGGRSGIPKIQ